MKILKITPFFLLFCISSYSQKINFSDYLISNEIKKDANAIILFENCDVDIRSQRSMIITIERAVTVLNKMGDNYKYVKVGYDKNTKIRNIETLVFDAFGTEIKKVKNKEYNDVSSYDGFSLYSDNRLKYYKYVPASYPYTIYVKYEIETVNTGFIPKWFPVDNYYTAVLNSTYTLKSPDDLKVRVKEKNFKGFAIEKNVTDFSLQYTLKNQSAYKNEPYSPNLSEFTPNVFVGLYKFSLEGINGEATNWEEFGKWQYDFLKAGNDKVDESIALEVNRLVEGITDPVEKAKKIYDYVQNRTRYISVQVGIGGWMPAKADQVHKLGYGDCKGLTNYTKALLDAADVTSHYTIVWSGNNKKNMEKDFFSMQGDHIILNIPNSGNDIWLECTSQKMPFGHLGNFTDDRDVLVVTPEGGIIKHTKIYESEENTQFTKGSYEIDEEGAITAKVKIESKGIQYDDDLFTYDGKSNDELDAEFKEYFSNINNIKFSKIEVLNNKEASKFEENLEFTASNYVSFSGDQMLIPINAFSQGIYVPKRISDRKLPIKIKRSYIDLDEVEIKLPQNYSIEYMPETTEVQTKFGTYSITISKVNENTYLYSRKLQMNEGIFSKEEYNEFRDFRKTIRKYDNTKIVLKKNTI